ncbi:MAG: class I SAM-dependent methyltransferase [Verrucomicrobiales bacterium]|nr:class I SAM-dependent methyltransferase [Verrucomicrobiales bacterium]
MEGRVELLVMKETALPPCVVFEDADLLVVHKPPGWNTHSPAPFAGEGIYEWFRNRSPRWERLAIIHRLDKDTSGLLVFGKTAEANRSLTEQFARRKVHKEYVLVTDRTVNRDSWVIQSNIRRVGDRYVSGSPQDGGDPAETRFRVLRSDESGTWIAAEPVTGRTHQIRVHASSHGFPILGDTLYGGAPAHRLHLHSGRLRLFHPRSGEALEWEVPPEFSSPASGLLRRAMITPSETDACRRIHGAADGVPGRYLDQLGRWSLVEGEGEAPSESEVRNLLERSSVESEGVYFKALRRHVRQTAPGDACPSLRGGVEAPSRFEIRENGLRFELSFQEGYSTGIFLDQRDNRRRLLTRHVGAGFPWSPGGDGMPGELLNCFAYTCAFSVAGAAGGMRTTSLDLSRKYLDWGRRNFVLNGLDPAGHDFIYGDVFDWLGRLAKKARRFQAIVLDPPTFSRSREHGDFRAESDYGDLVQLALPLLAPGGILLASTNASRLSPEDFVAAVRMAINGSGRRCLAELYIPQPPDFPITRDEPAHLKTFWCAVS